MNYGEGIAWIIVFKCSLQFIHHIEKNLNPKTNSRSDRPSISDDLDHNVVDDLAASE